MCSNRTAGQGLTAAEPANVVALPHIGSATHETRYNMAACAVDNLIDALNGNVEKNCVNPQVK